MFHHLDKLQEHLMKELTEAEKHITEETRDLIASLDEKQKELNEHQTNIVNIKSMHQTYKHILHDGNFRYSAMGIVIWPRDSFTKL
jgi:chromosome segregation ATPase